MNTFERDRIVIRYPTNWTVDEAADPESGGWTMTVSSPDTAFFMMSLQPDARDPGDLADQTLDALKGEYKELDSEEVTETICGQPAIGFNADFLTVDTATSCRVRCMDTFAGPLLLLTQVSEYDREQNEPVLTAIIKSLDVDAE
ncbi:Uncharacterized protein OS=Singulisphaera acidiphila (strain ATCC BAA-1392 / DSM 18658 / VKM B-2454 / MOB10) GN=Sinac_7295 PE=4 SV=1 [Gemmata massiliana]|uniref:DUF1795 domain-containing protein n=1 Tax=Gemmata massiliana TaxID=1210884 RepID=A0A6P2DHX2_9BACT|nr:hypothetical protein [Gemmata massiliana]VTR99690.1 Uncharacterized protein OS=Singulisphaera acidiphila (strain ATCC BAA-1392 / DSM 18658 / VKM B-2454 / MOB10) GN=Sinac_7295 PE=4 SV=1 [Gemmata massiliana]